MKWELVRLGDIVELSNGINFDKSSYQKGIKLINVSNFGNRFTPDYNELLEIKSSCVRESYILKDGDIIFVRSNGNKELVGRCMLIKHPPLPVTYSGFCIRARIIDKQQFDETFLTYHFKSILFRRSMSGTSVGANIQNLSQSRLSNYQFKLPDITIQRKIAKILSAYDNLIENNQKQIKLLEEAAQLLYKEWFVDLRFPGYENVPIVDGVPKGWKKFKLSEIAPIVTGKKDANYGIDKGGYLFFTCAQMPLKAPNFSFDCEAVILAGNGDFNVKLYRGKFEAYQRTYVLSPYINDNLYLLYYSVISNMINLFQGASGSTIKFLTKHMLEDIIVTIPNDNIHNWFNMNCESIQKKIECLKIQVNLLTEARDRLLPKLMNGELVV